MRGEEWSAAECRERVMTLSSKVINGREKLEHHPSSLLFPPSDAGMVLLGATIRAREDGEGEKSREQLAGGRTDMK